MKQKIAAAWSFIEEYATSNENGSVAIVSNKIRGLFPNPHLFPNCTVLSGLLVAVDKVYPEPNAPADLESARAALPLIHQILEVVCML